MSDWNKLARDFASFINEQSIDQDPRDRVDGTHILDVMSAQQAINNIAKAKKDSMRVAKDGYYFSMC